MRCCGGTTELPPLARGRAVDPGSGSNSPGITPARAGKRGHAGGLLLCARNYPRSRGEEGPETPTCAANKELPPLARGRAISTRVQHLAFGITPARAGKRRPHPHGRFSWRNYPRSRGEETSWPFLVRSFAELPPLARGREDSTQAALVDAGITPARAGKSVDRGSTVLELWNYPRSRGEERSLSTCCRSGRELPPLARGRDTSGRAPRFSSGITPARAGKRSAMSVGTSRSWNYPRSRGEENGPTW